MSTAKLVAPLMVRRRLSIAIVVYIIVWAAIFAWAFHLFDIRAAIVLSMILAFPFGIAVRMLNRWRSVRLRELIYILVLFILVPIAVVGYIRHCQDLGMVNWHKRKVACHEFIQLVRKDPAFRNVDVYISPKQIVTLRGTVASDADLDQLRALASRYQLIWWGENTVEIAAAQD